MAQRLVSAAPFSINPQNILTALFVFGAIGTFPKGLVQSGDGSFYGDDPARWGTQQLL